LDTTELREKKKEERGEKKFEEEEAARVRDRPVRKAPQWEDIALR